MSTLMRRDHVASTSTQRHFGTKCPLGWLEINGRGAESRGSNLNIPNLERLSAIKEDGYGLRIAYVVHKIWWPSKTHNSTSS